MCAYLSVPWCTVGAASSTMWILGIKLGLAGLLASTFNR